MKYFSVPTCPYCKKRVNLIRTWSLKRQGEYLCPRCGGISNIYLSPLVYVFALMAVLGAGALYFFHKFVLDDVSLSTVFQVLIPFVVFFLLSLFMVYLEKPVIKTVSKAEVDRRRRAVERREARRRGDLPSAHEDPQQAREEMFIQEDEYLPKVDYRTGPLPVSEPKPLESTSVIPVTKEVTGAIHKPMTLEQVTAPTKVAPARPAAEAAKSPRQSASAEKAAAPAAPESASKPAQPSAKPKAPRQPASADKPQPVEIPTLTPASQPEKAPEPIFEVVTPKASTEAPKPAETDDFFAKYDDPEYVERRLKELNQQRDQNN